VAKEKDPAETEFGRRLALLDSVLDAFEEPLAPVSAHSPRRGEKDRKLYDRQQILTLLALHYLPALGKQVVRPVRVDPEALGRQVKRIEHFLTREKPPPFVAMPIQEWVADLKHALALERRRQREAGKQCPRTKRVIGAHPFQRADIRILP
jgi:hypothetical protein